VEERPKEEPEKVKVPLPKVDTIPEKKIEKIDLHNNDNEDEMDESSFKTDINDSELEEKESEDSIKEKEN
jgi:hypothetical protein